MSRGWQTAVVLVGLAVAGVIVFFGGLKWGLPSRAVDPYLFGPDPAWSGREIRQLAGDWVDDRTRGADVDVDPLGPQDQSVCINETDAQRAAIARRYRLYTYQPDEMITLRALASMRPGEGRLDPQLYQYGGLWIYPVGALIRLAAAVGYVTLTPEVGWYLDRPAEFGKLYVVARLYTAGWAFVGIWAVYGLTRRLTGGCAISGAVAGLCVMVMPVVMNMAHEAKPHLPGAVLTLLAVLSAMRYVESGKTAWWALTVGLCGAAFGMVLSAWPVLAVLPVMLVLRRVPWEEMFSRTVFGCLIAGAVYLATNPYIAINLAVNREVLRSNFGNSLAMYEIARLGEGIINAAWLVVEGTSPILAVFGAGGAVWLAVSGLRRGGKVNGSEAAGLGWLLAAPAAVVLLQFVALAAGKPGEYGRFAVLPDVALGIAAITAIRRRIRTVGQGVVPMLLMVLTTASAGSEYYFGFLRDSSSRTSRQQTAWQLQAYLDSGARTMGVVAEPGPYDLPPVNLKRWKIYLLPANADAEDIGGMDVLVRPWGMRAFGAPAAMAAHRPDPPTLLELDNKPISWADKRFEVQVRKGSRR